MVRNSFALRKYLILFFGFSLHIAIAQNSITSDSFNELSAFESFQARKYQQVVGNLESKNNRSDDEEILLLLSQLKTGQGKPAKIERWLKQNPKHPIKPLVGYHLGEYYFYEKDTLRSKKYLSTIKANDLAKADKGSYGYVYGLLKLDEGKHQDAKNLFQFAENNGFEDIKKLDYYSGFASYHLGNREDALASFEKVSDTEEFGNSSKFFIAKIRLENGEADEVIQLTQSELSDDQTVTNSGFHQLIGEAYAQKNQVAKADAFFERAIELHPAKPSAALYYQAGVSKFKIGNEDLAIQFLTESGIQGGEYAQLSAFQLGRLYLKKKDYEKALTAYIEASASQDQTIKEEAYFQAANINATLENFTEAINYAIDYLKEFSDPQRREAMQNLIAQSYLRTSNYDLAIEHLTEAGLANNTQREVYQKVTYQKAILSFNDANFSEADKWFGESLRFPVDITLKNSAHYHQAEIAMQRNRFNDAIKHYKSQSLVDPLSHYGIGYAYYNMRKYEAAIPHFQSARNASETNIELDAKVRLADCKYATKSYAEALNIYNAVSQTNASPYLMFQKGMSLKSLDRGDDAIQSFQSISTSSPYASQATYQSGMIQFESANFTGAKSYFSQVISKHPTSGYYVESLLNRAISNKNLGNLEEAKNDFESILTDHIDSEAAINAILGLQELQQAGTEIPGLDGYIEQYRKLDPKNGSLELIEFEAAKQLYFNFSYEQSAQAFEKYLKDYPATGNATEAKYYQADSYYRYDAIESAKPLFDELKFIRNPLTGRILNRLGEINKRLNLPAESEEAYQLLIDLNLSPKDTYNARQGLMLLYFSIEQYDEAIAAADQIIGSEWKPLNAVEEATIVKARSWYGLNDLANAQKEYALLASSKDANGAEANYYLGVIKYQEQSFEESLDILFDLNANYGTYTEWVDKSYLLIAKNYIKMDELFQAKATLRSIIQHSKNEKVKIESQALLNEIEQPETTSDSTQIKD